MEVAAVTHSSSTAPGVQRHPVEEEEEQAREGERVEHIPGRADKSRGHGGHGGTRRANGGARPSLARPRQSRSTQHHHGEATASTATPGTPASSESPRTRATLVAVGLGANGGSLQSQIDADHLVHHQEASQMRPVSSPEMAGGGRNNVTTAAATANRQSGRGELGDGVPNFNQFLEKEKLKSNGSNFTDWFRHVRIFLAGGNLQYVLDAPLGDPPAETETEEVKNVYATRKARYSQVQCAILCSLEADLQKRFERHDPHELVNELKAIFETHAAVECYEASKHFFSCMMEEGSSVSEHMLVMTGHAKKLSDLGIVIPNRLGINCVLQSLPPSYKNFVMNYNTQNMKKELPELFGMLKAAEIEIKKEHQVLMVNKTTSFKKQGKSKGKFKKGGKKAATPPMKPKNVPKPDAECYYCKEKGHWKRNCSKYLADLKTGLVKKKKEGISDIHVIDVYLTGSRSSTWVFDTGSVAHICNSKQELKNKRRLRKMK
ncbi:hypothetical protein QYE76_066189 [Lolium multiflorum]|uniref:CCHC-type domain-containing protein n=1 Tax=Lolium multiflorum TaxID=4521 RepID=A0AAD8SAU8_LOLMU|nr:hypothetical protein QYE76_066189 [Lolium multiflorum]